MLLCLLTGAEIASTGRSNHWRGRPKICPGRPGLSCAALPGAGRWLGEEPLAVFDRRPSRPAPERFVERPHVGKADGKGELGRLEPGVAQVAARQLLPYVVQKLMVARPLLLELTAKGAGTHREPARDLVGLRRPPRQLVGDGASHVQDQIRL